MKKLLLLATLCIATTVQAFDKHGLETAIRSLDVTSVKQIIKSEKITVREYNRYLNLAEEIIRNREIWILKKNCYYDDITTPSTLSAWKIAAQLVASSALFSGAVALSDAYQFSSLKNSGLYSAIVIFSATALGVKSFIELIFDVKKQKKTFRKKYDDAVTIKQLVYTTDIVEA